jgi:uncharacterized membrane protein YdjX (TVP38/TMEM64 family)
MFTHTTISNRKLLLIILLSLAVLTIWYFRTPLAALLVMLQDQQAISAYVQQLGALGPLMLFALLVAQVFLAIIPGHALMMAGGYVYGPVVAISITAASTILGSQIAFWVARLYGRQLVYRLAKPDIINRWNTIAERQGALFFFFAFVLPIFPSDLMCYVAGLGKVSPKGFLVANVAGRLLCAIAVTLIGAFGFRPPWQFWALTLGGMAIFFVAWGVYKSKDNLPRSKNELAHVLGMWIMNTHRRIFSIQKCVSGLENVPPGPKILAVNHPNLSDAFLLPLLFDGHVRALIQASQFRAPLMGWIFTHTGQISISPECKLEAYQQACEALASGETVLIFSEGRLNPDNENLKIWAGAVRMTLKSGVPIITMGIYIPERDTMNLSRAGCDPSMRKLWQLRGKFTVHIGAPWLPGGELPEFQKPVQVHEMTRCLMEKIHTLRNQAFEEREA